MIYDDLMNAGSLPSRAGIPSTPQDHERSGRLVSRSSYDPPRMEKPQNFKIVIRGGTVTYAPLPPSA